VQDPDPPRGAAAWESVRPGLVEPRVQCVHTRMFHLSSLLHWFVGVER
jgi:hypothetical protein